jgi:hypothetical protein
MLRICRKSAAQQRRPTGCHTPADGRLAAAILAIRTSRRPIRENVERIIKLIRVIES